MAVSLVYDGQLLHWNDDGHVEKFHASSGLVETNDRMFRVGSVVYVFREDYRCKWYEKVRDRGPIPTGTYTVATSIPRNPYATFDAASCNLHWSNSVQQIPRGGDIDDQPAGGQAGQCEPYWANWGYNRTALVPHRDNVAPHRSGFFIHDSSKGFTHGCVEVDQKFFTNNLMPLVQRKRGVKIQLRVKYDSDFRTYGNTYAKSPSSGGEGLSESRQREALLALKALCERLRDNAPNSAEMSVTSTYKRPAKKITLNPPPQDRVLPYDYGLSLHYGANDLSSRPDVLSRLPAWWGNFT